LKLELSVLVARRPSGDSVVYAPALNHHVDGILEWSVLPGPIEASVAERAMALGKQLADALSVEGLLVTEFFLTEDGELLVNEMAPRPHNSFHTTEVACATSQFEQAVRAVCDLPLGSTEVIRPGAIVNLLGDLWQGDEPPAFDAALAIPGVKVHLYGKRQARPGRKMGHLSALGTTPQEALTRVQAALRLLEGI
jgi:5-(carboxyamino)imidazole ribonucleotide synthase